MKIIGTAPISERIGVSYLPGRRLLTVSAWLALTGGAGSAIVAAGRESPGRRFQGGNALRGRGIASAARGRAPRPGGPGWRPTGSTAGLATPVSRLGAPASRRRHSYGASATRLHLCGATSGPCPSAGRRSTERTVKIGDCP